MRSNVESISIDGRTGCKLQTGEMALGLTDGQSLTGFIAVAVRSFARPLARDSRLRGCVEVELSFAKKDGHDLLPRHWDESRRPSRDVVYLVFKLLVALLVYLHCYAYNAK